MKNPVLLPTSKFIVDYETIKAHLLNKPNDPFDKTILTLDKVIPLNDLREKIEIYKGKLNSVKK